MIKNKKQTKKKKTGIKKKRKVEKEWSAVDFVEAVWKVMKKQAKKSEIIKELHKKLEEVL